MDLRLLPTAATVTGVASLVTCVAATYPAGAAEALVPVLLPVSWWVAGLVALAARPDHLSARLLTGFGLLHLVAFAVSAVTGTAGSTGWPSWTAALAANIAYGLGFAVLAVLLATFPASRLRRPWLSSAVLALGVLVPVVTALTSPRLDLPLHVVRSSVAVPAPLPLGNPVDASQALPLMVVVSLVVLLVRTRRASGDRRRQLLWPAGVTAVLALLLLATPPGTMILGRAWALVFIPVVLALPIALLAGLRRFRLLQVELYAARTVAGVALLALVMGAYAALAALAGSRSPVAAVVVAVAAALTGHRLLVWLEERVDRVVSGGRIRGHAVLRHLAASLEAADPQAVAMRTAETIASALEIGWVEVQGREVVARAGDPTGSEPQVSVPLLAPDGEIGTIACGRRRGGWSTDDVELLELVGRHAGLALRGAELSQTLARRVEELTASRERLVHAEDEARRRLERDLHDGIQQQVVVLLGRLGLLATHLGEQRTQSGVIESLVGQSQDLARRILEELRLVGRGIHPPMLTDRGLVAALEAQADLLTIPVVIDVDPRLEGQRFPDAVEAAAYYVVSEAVTNVIKHSGAAQARVVLAAVEGGTLQVAVVDDGTGIAAPGLSGGSGLRGLRDRAEAVGGTLEVQTADAVGTTVIARFPLQVAADV